jgi:hypothetical protein
MTLDSGVLPMGVIMGSALDGDVACAVNGGECRFEDVRIVTDPSTPGLMTE